MVLARRGRTMRKHAAPEEAGAGAGGGPAWDEAEEPGAPQAMFIPHNKSLPFEERLVSLEQPVKIGRNVYRAVPSPTNTIFECRVLSRHHATLWYEKGHFYIMDNQSSNGTFINNNRCSISKESEPHEVFSGDIVQFGIAVVENQTSNTGQNTFLPVVARLKLFHPDGKEAKLTFNPTMTTPLHLKELYQLNNFVQEAVGREAALEGRLRNLRECVERTRAEALSGWELLVGEQRLLARVHALEATVAAGKPLEQAEVAHLLEDKRNYQEVAQENLRLAHEQRLALEEALEKKSREVLSLHQHNCMLRQHTNNALAELQKLAALCDRKMCAARFAIAAAEDREKQTRTQLPLALWKTQRETHMLMICTQNVDMLEDSTLEGAIRSLPDVIKMLLPQNILSMVGLKVITLDAKKISEIEMKMKKNDELLIYDMTEDLENRICKEEDAEDKSKGELDSAADTSTDDEKNGRLNHDSGELNSTTVLDTELINSDNQQPQPRADNNANSTFHPHENHNDLPLVESDLTASVQALRAMAGLTEEVQALRQLLDEVTCENDKMRQIRDQLLSVKLEKDGFQRLQTEVITRDEQIAALRHQLEALENEAKVAAREVHTCHRSVNTSLEELREPFTDSAYQEVVNSDINEVIKEIDGIIKESAKDNDIKNFDIEECLEEVLLEEQRNALHDLDCIVNSEIEDHEELTTEDTNEITKDIEEALLSMDEAIGLDSTEDASHEFYMNECPEERSKGTEIELNETSEMDRSMETNESIVNETNEANESGEESVSEPKDSPSESDATVAPAQSYIKLEDDERLKVTLQNGTLHALEEELVLAKERWAEQAAENARLNKELQRLQTASPFYMSPLVTYGLPLFAGVLYLMFYQYIS